VVIQRNCRPEIRAWSQAVAIATGGRETLGFAVDDGDVETNPPAQEAGGPIPYQLTICVPVQRILLKSVRTVTATPARVKPTSSPKR